MKRQHKHVYEVRWISTMGSTVNSSEIRTPRPITHMTAFLQKWKRTNVGCKPLKVYYIRDGKKEAVWES